MNRRRLRRWALVQLPSRNYLLPALLTTRKIAAHLDGRPVIESQHGDAVLEKIIVQCTQIREIKSVVGPVVKAREKLRYDRRLLGLSLRDVDELRERIEAAVAIAGTDLSCALRKRLASVRVRKNSVMVYWKASSRCSGTSLVIRKVLGCDGMVMVLHGSRLFRRARARIQRPKMHAQIAFISALYDERSNAGRHFLIKRIGDRKAYDHAAEVVAGVGVMVQHPIVPGQRHLHLEPRQAFSAGKQFSVFHVCSC
jgi:hypothetical protein